MNPERIARLVDRWVRCYTSGLPRTIAQRRLEEIRADLHDQIAHELACGTQERRIGALLVSRAVRGATADIAWRSHLRRTTRPRHEQERNVHTPSLTTSAVRIAAFVAAVLSIPAIAMVASDDADWGVVDFVLAGLLLAVVGVCASVAARRRGSVLIAVVVAVAGVLAAVAGQVDDAPGLIVLGGLLLAGAAAMATRRRSPVTS